MKSEPDCLDPRYLYQRRFEGEATFRNRMWRILCRHYFQRFVATDATVLEIAAGHCEFINNIRAGRKIAFDVNDATRILAGSDVEVHIASSTDLGTIPDGGVDVVFISNFLEHLVKDEITATLRESFRVLREGGQLLVLQPNIRYCYRDYWMFYDHITPLDDRALCEAMEVIGFRIVGVIPKFLPFTTKSRLPRSPFLIKWYLRIPLLWKLFGGQAFIVGAK